MSRFTTLGINNRVSKGRSANFGVGSGGGLPAPVIPAVNHLWGINPGDLSTLWRDVGKTIQVTEPLQVVKVAEDTSGRGNDWFETDDVLIYNTDGVKHWFEYPGAAGDFTTANFAAGTLTTNSFASFAVETADTHFALGDASNSRYFGVFETGDSSASYNGVGSTFVDAVDGLEINFRSRSSLFDAFTANQPFIYDCRGLNLGTWPHIGLGRYGTGSTRFTGRLYGYDIHDAPDMDLMEDIRAAQFYRAHGFISPQKIGISSIWMGGPY